VAFSAVGPSGNPVFMQFMVSNETFTDADINQTFAGLLQASNGSYTLVSNGRVSSGGRSFYQFKAEQASGVLGEPVFLTFSFIQCTGYSLFVEEFVPEDSVSEELIFSSMLESVSANVVS
jgi:hypothetical protein